MNAAIPNIIEWLIISFSKDSSFLYMGGLLEGFGIGVTSCTMPLYIAEISSQNMRGSLGFVNQLSVTIGIMLAYLLGLFVNWRVLAILGILPCTLLIPGLFFIPESPRWLAKMGMTQDFEASLQVLRGFDTDISIEVIEIKRSAASSSRRTTIQIAELKLKRYWFPLMIGIGLLVLQQLSGTNGVLFYSGISSRNVATFGLGLVQVVATGVKTWLMDKAGCRLLLLISSSGMTASMFLVSIAFFLEGVVSKDSHLYSSILGIVSLVGLVALVISSLWELKLFPGSLCPSKYQKPCWQHCKIGKLAGIMGYHNDCKFNFKLEHRRDFLDLRDVVHNIDKEWGITDSGLGVSWEWHKLSFLGSICLQRSKELLETPAVNAGSLQVNQVTSLLNALKCCILS